MKASVMLEHEEKYTIILAFDVKIERDAQEMADNMGVKIFQVGKLSCHIKPSFIIIGYGVLLWWEQSH